MDSEDQTAVDDLEFGTPPLIFLTNVATYVSLAFI